MKRQTIWTVCMIASLGLLVATGCSGKQEKKDKQPTAEESASKDDMKKSVVLYQYRFNPNSLTVKKGTTVEFQNKDQEKHNVKIAALDIDKNLEPDQTFEHTFETTGEFAVENRMAEKQMKMTIVVEE
jgi:plastocyanin